MKFLADAHISIEMVAMLRDLGHDCVDSSAIPPRMLDVDVLRMAANDGRVMVTSDKDFGELVFVHGIACPGVVLIRVALADESDRVANVRSVWPTVMSRLPHSSLGYRTPAVFSASLAEAPVGAAPLPAPRPAKRRELILSKQVVQRLGAGHCPEAQSEDDRSRARAAPNVRRRFRRQRFIRRAATPVCAHCERRSATSHFFSKLPAFFDRCDELSVRKEERAACGHAG